MRRRAAGYAPAAGVSEVPPAQRKIWPYCAIGRLLIKFAGQPDVYLGSATVVAPHTLLTAAHNAFESRLGGIAQTIEFQPGFDDSAGAAQGGEWIVTQATTPTAWRRDRDFRYDFALLTVRPVGGVGVHQRCGSIGVKSRLKPGADCQLIGYPVGPPYKGNEMMLANAGATSFDRAFSADEPLSAVCSLGEGMSGGPWFERPAGSDAATISLRGLTSYSRGDGLLYSPWFGSVFETFFRKHVPSPG